MGKLIYWSHTYIIGIAIKLLAHSVGTVVQVYLSKRTSVSRSNETLFMKLLWTLFWSISGLQQQVQALTSNKSAPSANSTLIRIILSQSPSDERGLAPFRSLNVKYLLDVDVCIMDNGPSRSLTQIQPTDLQPHREWEHPFRQLCTKCVSCDYACNLWFPTSTQLHIPSALAYATVFSLAIYAADMVKQIACCCGRQCHCW